MKYPLYDYQQIVVDKILNAISKGITKILAQLPTRAGKSLVASDIIEKYKAMGKSVWFMCHTTVLVTQMSEELSTHEIDHGIIKSGFKLLRKPIQIISKDTLINAWPKMKQFQKWPDPDVIFIDECHLAKGKTYEDIIKQFPGAILIGLTATPIRLDGKGLNGLFDKLIIGPSIKELQLKERLCPVDSFRSDFDMDDVKTTSSGDYSEKEILKKVDKPKIIADIVSHWEEHALNRKTLTFCASIGHGQHLADAFNLQGYPSVCVSSKDKPDEIKRKLDLYYAGKYINLISVNLFIMGFTVKDCDCIIQARPTQSLMIYLQTVGRGMVYLPGKRLINLDCVDNYSRHGSPEMDREWTLAGKNKKKQEEPSLIKQCYECLYPVDRNQMTCPSCGFEFEELLINSGRSRTPEETEGKMIKVVD